MSLIEREKALDAERVRRQNAAGWSRGAHIPGTSIDWRAEALALEAQLAGAVWALAQAAAWLSGDERSAILGYTGLSEDEAWELLRLPYPGGSR